MMAAIDQLSLIYSNLPYLSTSLEVGSTGESDVINAASELGTVAGS